MIAVRTHICTADITHIDAPHVSYSFACAVMMLCARDCKGAIAARSFTIAEQINLARLCRMPAE
jgi:hypothetical protein